MKKAYILTFSLMLVCSTLLAQNYEIPRFSNYVVDLAGKLNPEQEADLISRSERLHDVAAGSQVAILIIPVLPENAADEKEYATAVFNTWKLGDKEKDNGALILVAIGNHKMRIETGYGNEGPIPDITAKHIIDDQMTPAFKKDDFYGGLLSAHQSISGHLLKEFGATDSTLVAKEKSEEDGGLFAAIFVFVVLGAVVLIVASFIRFSTRNTYATESRPMTVLPMPPMRTKSRGRTRQEKNRARRSSDDDDSPSYKPYIPVSTPSHSPSPSPDFGSGGFGGFSGGGGGSSGGGGASGSW